MLKKSKPLILHIIDSLEIGGAEKLLVNTIDALPNFDHVICYLGGANKFHQINNVSEIINLNHDSNKRFFYTVLSLRQIIKQKNPVLVHAHLLKSTWVARFATLKKYPFVFTLHNKLSEDAFKVNKLSLYFEKLTYKKRQVIIGVSKEVIADYNEWVGVKGTAAVLYNMVEDKFFQPCIKRLKPNDHIKLIAVGNLRRQKNYTNLLKAFLPLKVYNISLDIYGSGDEEALLQKFINQHGLSVNLKGKVENVNEVMCDYDAFVLPSIFEGYGIAVVEAMAAGLPVLLSDIDVFKEVTNNTALYYNPLVPDDISKIILEFYHMPTEDKTHLSEKMKKRAIEIGSKELFKRNLLQIYSEASNQDLAVFH